MTVAAPLTTRYGSPGHTMEALAKTVEVPIPLAQDVAATLTDAESRAAAGRLLTRIPRLVDATIPDPGHGSLRGRGKSQRLDKARMGAKVIALADGGDTDCLIFYMKSHGWSEKLVIAEAVHDDDDPNTWSDAKLAARIAVSQRAEARDAKRAGPKAARS